MNNFLTIRDLNVVFNTRRGKVHAVRNLNFSLDSGKVLGIVGESGSGKSVSMNALMRLIATPNVEISGSINYKGQELLELTETQMQSIRGKEISMIFQDPLTAFTPVYTVGWHIVEQIQLHSSVSKKVAREQAIELLDQVGIPSPHLRVDQYPHEYSGGMRQRAFIAMSLALKPALLIADEPTTALDVTIQAQILDLLKRLQKEHNSSIIIITHDMGVVSEISDEVLVMYAGSPVEKTTTKTLFSNPIHPYTRGLLDSIPNVDSTKSEMLKIIPGQPASLLNLPSGCVFRDRCFLAKDECANYSYQYQDSTSHFVECDQVSK